MKVNNCRCGSHNLKAKFNSDTKEEWIICDNCGNMSSQNIISDLSSYKYAIEQWNKENPVSNDRIIKETEDCIVKFNDNKDIRDRVFDAVIKWCFEYGLFSGECIHQCDSGQIEAPNLLSNIVDDIIKFDVEYKE